MRCLLHFLASVLKGNLASWILELPFQALGKETWEVVHLGWSPRGYLPHLVQEVRLQWLLLLA